jgi:hypothetical protein
MYYNTYKLSYMPDEKTDLQQDNKDNNGLQLDPEMEDMRNTSSEPNKENQQIAMNAGSEQNDNKANSSRVRSNN